MKKIRVGIIGGAGYTGGELIRLLIHHPNVEICFVHSKSNAGNSLSQVHQDLVGDIAIKFTAALNDAIDLLFLCTAHGEARKFLEENKIAPRIKIIDLSNDFRLNTQATTGTRKFIYGLPELNKQKIINADNIANPGCFATAVQLGLLPLANAGLLNEVYTTGITGSTGAGQSLTTSSHFSWRVNNIQAYKTLTHQHLAEIYQSLHQLQKSFPEFGDHNNAEKKGLHFVPWRGDFARGIFVSSTLHCKVKLDDLNKLYNDFYSDQHFTVVSNQPVFLKQVTNTNKCILYLEKAGDMLVVHSVTDNLLKGASGQAVQNMNLLFGMDETAGLHLKANYF